MASTSATSRVLATSPSSRTYPKLSQLSSLPPIAPLTSGLSPVAPSLTTSPTATSLQSSPEGLQARSIPSHCPTPLQLPDSAITSPILQPQTFANDTSSPLPPKDGLIRRVSRSAMNAPTRLLRHRQSSNNVTDRDRDQSSGPLIMRRQSSATNSVDPDSTEPSLDGSLQLPETLLNISTAGLLQHQQSEFQYRGASLQRNAFARPSEHDDSYEIVNKSSQVDKTLQAGTKLVKITGKKRKDFVFVLDPASVKISWHPSDSTKRLYIDDILEIRKQKDAANYRQELGVSEDCESRWFTIIYTDPNRLKGRPTKTMHLVAPDQQIFDKWTQNLELIIDSRQRTMQLTTSGRQGSYDMILPELWRREMDKLNPAAAFNPVRKESIDFLGVQTVCRSLHMDCNRDWLLKSFNEADIRKRASLNYDEFSNLFRQLKRRSEVEIVYQSLVEPGTDGITLLSFFNFLRDTQGVDIDNHLGKWANVFHDCVHRFSSTPPESPTNTKEETMNLEAFTLFLSSAANDTLRAISQPRSLDQPLNQYFISSSHNTYLMGRQVAGMSSTEAYVIALKKGCRCVEIDCWDGDNGQPIVTHGRTMTSQVSFQDCINVIAKYAFYKSEYPLILSLEVHCNPAQQQIMRNIMEKELGDALVKNPIANAKTLPSPEELKRRVLVKVKAHNPLSTTPPTSTTPATVERPLSGRQRSLSSPQTRPPSMMMHDSLPPLLSPSTLAPLDLPMPPGLLPSRPSLISLNSSTEESDVPFGTDGAMRQHPKPPKSKIVQNLGELGVYTSGIKYRSFAFPEAKSFNHVFSLAEGPFQNLYNEDRNKLVKHNTKYLMRVYPAQKRIRSSNFNPLICWRAGVQMAALNWQTYDIGMQLNDAMFASQADIRGYVLKPEELRLPPPKDAASQTGSQKMQIRFTLDLVSGQQLPRPHSATPDMVSSPYVEIELLCAEDPTQGIASGVGGQDASRSGVSGIGAPHRRRSRIVEKNGYNPQFQETFKLSLATSYPSLVFVRWSVWSSPDGRTPSSSTVPLATFTAKLSDLEQGFRHLPLYDHNGEKLLSTLFCRITKEQPIPLDGFGVDGRETTEKSSALKSIGGFLKRSLSASGSKAVASSRRLGVASGRRQSKERNVEPNEPKP